MEAKKTDYIEAEERQQISSSIDDRETVKLNRKLFLTNCVLAISIAVNVKLLFG
ncbi:hypothetical protein [Sporolactobacillus putidus]|uniref:Uncharacterized protein n=1 Tax=Sporolactobacillus putidus TaxID=492735 RepID=A0A917SAE7_9BACL|nr:hypothetical protein [Sporolactobacillus putidus]GGL64440.1 hypothetical protein GCM10007968_30430 [Sporolactobacillus putidus]